MVFWTARILRAHDSAHSYARMGAQDARMGAQDARGPEENI
ncbi:MAG TPA: hypothetical protein VK634_14510 [Reyranella sp.]|nr:hypothetical protein [Reyranella sp.]